MCIRDRKSTQQTLRNQLRQQIRKTRANLTALQQQQAEDSITQQALALIEAQNAVSYTHL